MRKRSVIQLTIILGLLLAACGGGQETGSKSPQEDGASSASGDGETSGDDGSGGSASATVTIDGQTWELPNVACRVTAGSFDFLAAEGIIGASSGPTLAVNVVGDPETTEGGVAEVVFFSGPLTDPDLSWRASTDIGNAVVRLDGSRMTVEGLYDDGLTATIEKVEGSIEGDCGQMPEVPEVTATLPPDYEVDGEISVGGDTFQFTYDPEAGGRCGFPGNEGRVSSTGFLVGEPGRSVTFTYGLPEATTDGEAHMQLIIDGPDGQQLWYSAVGFFAGSSTGSVETLSQEGTTVTATGTLLRSGSDPEELAEFSIEATCDNESASSDETTASDGAGSGQATARATVEYDGQVIDFDEASSCFFREGAPPLLATFGDEIVLEGSNGLKIGRASADSRLILVIGDQRWDTRTSRLPQIVDGTATWEALEMDRTAESSSGPGTDIMTITINC